MRVLLQRIEVNYESAEDAVEYALSGFLGTLEEFTLLQQHFCPSFYQLPKRDQIKLALQIFSGCLPSHFGPELIRSIVGMDDLVAADINEVQSFWTISSTLVHTTAQQVGDCQRYLQQSDNVRGKQLSCDPYNDLFRELLWLGADVHTIANDMTPFQAFLKGYFSMSTFSRLRNGSNACNSAVHTWLGNLDTVGIDLAAYGEAEQYNWINKASRREFSGWNIEEQSFDTQRVIGFAYGPSPKDWHIWLAEASDPLVGQFWDMFERPVEEMPGSWPEK